MGKVLGFLLGIVVALAGPVAFGELAMGGDVDLSTRETVVVYAIWAVALWIAVSLFAGAGALGAALTFGAMTYAVHVIPNRTANFLSDIPGVTTAMIEGMKKAVNDGLVPILGVITFLYMIQLIVLAARRRSLQRAEEEREAQAYEEARLAQRGDETDPLLGDTGEQTRIFARNDATSEYQTGLNRPSAGQTS